MLSLFFPLCFCELSLLYSTIANHMPKQQLNQEFFLVEKSVIYALCYFGVLFYINILDTKLTKNVST